MSLETRVAAIKAAQDLSALCDEVNDVLGLLNRIGVEPDDLRRWTFSTLFAEFLAEEFPQPEVRAFFIAARDRARELMA